MRTTSPRPPFLGVVIALAGLVGLAAGGACRGERGQRAVAAGANRAATSPGTPASTPASALVSAAAPPVRPAPSAAVGVVDVVRPVATAEVADPSLVLWYDRPATDWERQALPIGNGHVGGMVFGGPARERVQFNEKTLWEGSETTFGAYQTFGDLRFAVPGAGRVTDYRLRLDIENALASVDYAVRGARFHREYFVSYPDRVLVVRLSGPAGKVGGDFALGGGHDELPVAADARITFSAS